MSAREEVLPGPFQPARRRAVTQIAAVPHYPDVHPGALVVLCDDGSVWTRVNAPGASWFRDDLSAVEFGE